MLRLHYIMFVKDSRLTIFLMLTIGRESFQQALPSLISTKAVGNTALVEENSSQPGHRILMGNLETSPSSGAALVGSRATYGGAALVFALDFCENNVHHNRY
jgi:hypothetical protein